MSESNGLRGFRDRLGISQADVADELVRLADADGDQVNVDASMISKWERGAKRPRRHYRRLFCRFYDATEEELGFRVLIGGKNHAAEEQLSSVANICRVSTSEAILISNDVTARDFVSRQEFLSKLSVVSGSLLLQQIMHLAGATSDTKVTSIEKLQSHHLGENEILFFEEQILNFSKWSSQSGTHMRKAVIAQVRTISELLEEMPSGSAKTLLFELAAQVAQQAGLMSYDCRLFGMAQRYYALALQFSKEAGNRLISAKVFSDMACISIDTGKHQDAEKLISFAISSLPTSRQSFVQAELFARLASTQERLGNTLDAQRSIEVSIRANGDSPDARKLPGFNNLHSSAAHRWIATTYLDLARGDKAQGAAARHTACAEQHIRKAIDEGNSYSRRAKALDTIRLMEVRLLENAPREAVALGNSVLSFAGGVRSSRIVDRLVRFYRDVQKCHSHVPEIEDFRERLRAYLIRSGETDVFAIA